MGQWRSWPGELECHLFKVQQNQGSSLEKPWENMVGIEEIAGVWCCFEGLKRVSIPGNDAELCFASRCWVSRGSAQKLPARSMQNTCRSW